MASPESTSLAPEPARDAVFAHTELRTRFEAERARHEKESDRFSIVRLGTFLAAAVTLGGGVVERNAVLALAGCVLFAAFFGAVIVQRRVLAREEGARIRRDVHDRHLRRLRGALEGFATGEELVAADHAYARDIDLVGEGSLFARVDVTHTVHGERVLASWLSAPASREAIARRQEAVRELADKPELRQELEAAALAVSEEKKLDGGPFRALAELPPYFEGRGALIVAIFVLPLTTLAAYVLGQLAIIPPPSWLAPVAVQVLVLLKTAPAVTRAFNLAAARQGAVEAFERLLIVVETARFESPLLVELQRRLAVDGTQPSVHMRRLRTWTSLAELRQQFLFYIFVNPLTLWDLHVLRGLERWNREVGRHTSEWFEALGEIEALSSLATLAYGDPNATMPEIDDGPLDARGLVHPLLPSKSRVENDVRLPGPGSAWLVTGSNMAGKSTLLRAVGLNVALALAGGPVCARSMRVPLVRVRASMRVADSLQRGASYFHAELAKLRSVVEGAEQEPPVLFLLDELLRGTNAQARHVGARAVLLHLLDRGGMGLVATHDVALSVLESEQPDRVHNVHFTDVVVDGEMRFDYRLREGVVRTSNALRLLRMAGIDVPENSGVELLELSSETPRPAAAKEESA